MEEAIIIIISNINSEKLQGLDTLSARDHQTDKRACKLK